MNKIVISIIIMGLLSLSSIVNINAHEIGSDMSEEICYPIPIDNEPFEGYTLFAPMYGKMTYLIDNDGKIVHTWISKHSMALGISLLENGYLVRSCGTGLDLRILLGGKSGAVEMFDWNGSLLWYYECVGKTYCAHNDIEVLQNGNVLMTIWGKKTNEEAIAAGCDPNLILPDGFWIDYIIEVEPTFPSGGNIVWEWHVWDHLIQDYDDTKENYGVVSAHPELVDINFRDSGRPPDWTGTDVLHINSVDYNETNDQILLSLRALNEIWVIDHSTTTEEAVNHTGGNSGKGGDILYRWGNPQVYRRGDADDQKLFTQHDARWIEYGCPGEGHISIFNNGLGRPDGNYSSVLEIIPPIDSNSNYYVEPDYTYGPEEPVWTYTAENPTDFYSPYLSSARRLPNGNTLICEGEDGHFFEVTPQKEIVWQYFNLFPIPLPGVNIVFKAQRYPIDYPGIGETSTDIISEMAETQNTLAATTQTYAQTIPLSQTQSSSQPSSKPISKITTQTIIGFTTPLGKTASK